MQVTRSKTLTLIPFEQGYDLYVQLTFCITPSMAAMVLGQLADYSHADFATHMQAVGHLAVREDINPRHTIEQQQRAGQIEGLIVAIGVEMHRVFTEQRLFASDSYTGKRSFPYELHSIKNDTLVLNRLIYTP